MRRWLPRLLCRPTRNDLFRLFLIALVVVYGSLFISTIINISHNDESASNNSGMLAKVLRRSFQGTSTTSTTKGNTIYVSRNRLPILKKAERKDQNSSVLHIPVPVRQDWVNGISEGNANQYVVVVGEEKEGISNHLNLWDRSNVIPPWMKQYFQWHKTQRQLLLELSTSNKDREDWKSSFRFLLMECTDMYRACGGTADRLGPIPFGLAVANATNRILLLHWTQPAPLESFLLPPLGGLDWRVPDWLWHEFQHHTPQSQWRAVTHEEKILEFAPSHRFPLIRMKFQSHTFGAEYYNAHVRTSMSDPTFEQVYHDMWRVLFTPAPAIATLIERHMEDLGLQPGLYVAVHIRALYAVEDREQGTISYWAKNGIHCATSQFQNNTWVANHNVNGMAPPPILFVSDSSNAATVALSYVQQTGLDKIVTRPHDRQPLHLEKDGATTALALHDVSDYYDTFIDLYMLGMSRCTAYNMGNFGRWGSLIGYNSSCTYNMKANMVPCSLRREGRQKAADSTLLKLKLARPLFIPAMANTLTTTTTTTATTSESASTPHQVPQEVPKDMTVLPQKHGTDTTNGPNFSLASIYEPHDGLKLWNKLEHIPKWMREYFEWHEEMRQKVLNPVDWQSLDYLVMQCLKTAEKCGGTSDRLKPTPTLLRMAHLTKRFLVIQWQRPCKLEEFLVPPKGGIDWRVPEWLGPELEVRGISRVIGDDVREVANSTEKFVRSAYQSFNGGSGWYNEQLSPGETDFDQLYHEVWRIFFTPSPPVARQIQSELDHLGLVPGEYSSAHVRALYAIDYRPLGSIKRWTRNGLNCASGLRPGKPIFFASDSSIASEMAVAYGRNRSLAIVVHKSNPNPPLHLDKPDGNATRPPSDFYDTFIDLYLLALGGCVFHNKGGFGSWGLLIGGNISCVHRQRHSKKYGIQNPCNWTKSNLAVTRPVPTRKPFFLEPMD